MLKHLAGWTAAAAAVVLMAASTAHAGRLAGPGSDNSVVSAFSTVTYTERFEGDEPAVISVKGDGDTLLGLQVIDENGHVIDSDVGYTCSVHWTPAWTGSFKVKVINLGGDSNMYRLKTN